MALFIGQNDERSELQKQIALELQRKAKQASEMADRPDGVEDSQYVTGMKKTTNLAWIWTIIIITAVVAIIWLTVISMAR